jgi:basic membrane lipoprotein Med (substrate-binding protein (PBP1-ABC) superfamily)
MQSIAVLIIIIIAALGIGGWYMMQPAPGPGPTTTEAPMKKVALIMPGSITDHGWDQEPYEGLMKAKADFGLEVSYTEEVMVTGTPADYDRILRDYVSKGFGFVICHDFLCKDSVTAVAKDNPKVWFAYDGARFDPAIPNLLPYIPWGHEPAYIAGVFAALMSKTGTVGAYDGIPIHIEVACVEAFEMGAKAANPNINVLKNYIGVWHDPKKGHDLVVSMADAGADIVYGVGDGINVGGIQGAKEKGIWFVGGTGDQRSMEPGTVIVSVSWGLGPIIYTLAKLYSQDKLSGTAYEFTMHTYIDGKQTGPDFLPWTDANASKVPQNVQDAVAKARADIMSGALVVPLITQAPAS